MEKKQTIFVVCGPRPSSKLAGAIASMEEAGLNVVVTDGSKDASDAIKGYEADLVYLNEAGPVRSLSEAFARVVESTCTTPGSIKVFRARVKPNPSKCYPKFTKKITNRKK